MLEAWVRLLGLGVRGQLGRMGRLVGVFDFVSSEWQGVCGYGGGTMVVTEERRSEGGCVMTEAVAVVIVGCIYSRAETRVGALIVVNRARD